MIPIIVISMKHSHHRRAFMKRQFDKLHLQHCFFDAVDGRALSEIELGHIAPIRLTTDLRPLMPAEIGCALSHLAVLKQISNDDNEFVAVLEDDTVLSPDFPLFIEEQTLRSLPQFDVLYLANVIEKTHRLAMEVGRVGTYGIRARLRCEYAAHAIVYSRAAAQRIAATLTSISSSIDAMLFYDHRVFGLRILETYPAVAQPDLNPAGSTIGHRPQPSGIWRYTVNNTLRPARALHRLRNFTAAWGLPAVLRLHRIATMEGTRLRRHPPL